MGGKRLPPVSLLPRKESVLLVEKAVWTLAPVRARAENLTHTSVRTPKHPAPALRESLYGMHCSDCLILIFKAKDRVRPRTDHKGPEGEQMYSSTLPSTSALDGGGWPTPRPGPLTPGKDPVPIVWEAG